MRCILVFMILGLGLVGCDDKSGAGGNATGPGISVHCAAQAPVGDTTTVVKCAPQEARRD